jgi:hypothetical protein
VLHGFAGTIFVETPSAAGFANQKKSWLVVRLAFEPLRAPLETTVRLLAAGLPFDARICPVAATLLQSPLKSILISSGPG